MNLHYKLHRGSVLGFNEWKAIAIGFMLLSGFMTLVALHCAKPIHCDYESYDNQTDNFVCEIIER